MRSIGLHTLVLVVMLVFASGCGTNPDDVTVPTGAIQNAEGVQAQAGLKMLETALMGCYAESQTFVGCQNAVATPGVTITSTTATSYELQAGDTISRYDATRDTTPCHATVSAPTTCVPG